MVVDLEKGKKARRAKKPAGGGGRGRFRPTAATFRYVAFVSIFLLILLVDFRSRNKTHVLYLPHSRRATTTNNNNNNNSGASESLLPAISVATRESGQELEAVQRGEEVPNVVSDAVASHQAEEGAGVTDGWGAFEQVVDPNEVELAPLNTLLNNGDPLLSCCPKFKAYDAVCTCAPALTKFEEVKLNLTTQMVRHIMDEETDRAPMNLVSAYYSEWKANLEANPDATLGQKQIFCTETLLEQADAAIKKVVERRKKKLLMGVSEGNLPWILRIDNIAHASKLEIHRAKETSQACMSYIDVIEQENELKEQLLEKERQERRAKRAAQRLKDKRRNRNKDLTKASSFNCDELKDKSEFRDYYHKICGKNGEGKGRAKILGTNVIMTN